MDKNATIVKNIFATAEKYPDIPAYKVKDVNGDFQDTSYKRLTEIVSGLGVILNELGIKRDDHVGIISDNRYEWILSDLAVLGLGAADVPRGSDSTADEIRFILNHSDCSVTFAENRTQTEKILSKKTDLPALSTIIVYDSRDVEPGERDGVSILLFQDLLSQADAKQAEKSDLFREEMEKGQADDLATIIYTSGTTGEPKGVMTAHRSYLFQTEKIDSKVHIKPGHVFLTVLPVWHSFERAVEYIILDHAGSMAYSKPVGKIMIPDMAKVKPHWMMSVPRIWEGVYAAINRNVKAGSPVKKALFHFFVSIGSTYARNRSRYRGLLPRLWKGSRILDKLFSAPLLIVLAPLKALGDVLVFKKFKTLLGGRFIAGISGGGALPQHVDDFFSAAGILLLEGYGLTETGPVLSVRTQTAPIPGTIGSLLPGVEYRVLDKDMAEVPQGDKGVLWVKSIQNMDGYYKRPDLTAEIIQDGWLNTGDLVRITAEHEHIIIVGRAKETIVLLGGENIEPNPIEDRLLQNECVDQVMVIGQDRKFLGALIIPNMEFVEQWASDNGISYMDIEDLLGNKQLEEYFHDVIQASVSTQTGFKPFERIFRFKLLSKAFEAGDELTHTLKIRRNVVTEKYRDLITEIFS